jgi:prophage regulatory protein
MDTKQTQRFLRRPEVRKTTGLSTSTLYDLMSEGKFPRPVRIGGNAVAWVSTEIEAWQQERIAARDASRGVEAA